MSVSMLMGSILMDRGVITEEQLEQALDLQSRSNLRLGEILVLLHFTEEAVITKCLSEQFDLPLADLSQVTPSSRALDIVPCSYALSRMFLAVELLDNTLTAVIADPTDLELPEDVAGKTGLRLSLSLAPPSQLLETIARCYVITAEELHPNPVDERQQDAA